jgi:hypothetical protein
MASMDAGTPVKKWKFDLLIIGHVCALLFASLFILPMSVYQALDLYSSSYLALNYGQFLTNITLSIASVLFSIATLSLIYNILIFKKSYSKLCYFNVILLSGLFAAIILQLSFYGDYRLEWSIYWAFVFALLPSVPSFMSISLDKRYGNRKVVTEGIGLAEIIKRASGWCPLLSMKNTVVDSGVEYVYASGTKRGGVFANKNTVYEEKAPYSNLIKLVMVSGLFSLAFLYFLAVFGNAPEQAEFALLLAVSISAMVMWSFFSIKFRITNDSVEAVMPPFKYRIPFSEIKEMKTIEDIPWYAGWGVRLWGRRLAFISMRKSAVLIEKKKGFFRKLILTTQNPEDFIKRLEEEMK